MHLSVISLEGGCWLPQCLALSTALVPRGQAGGLCSSDGTAVEGRAAGGPILSPGEQVRASLVDDVDVINSRVGWDENMKNTAEAQSPRVELLQNQQLVHKRQAERNFWL